MRHIIPISGKDSLATALVQNARKPELEYEYVFNPTGLELPEVFDWIDRVGTHFGREVAKVGKPLKEIIEGYGYFLPSQRARYCTKESKILPFIDWIGGQQCTAYYGIRADEQRDGFNNTTSPNITPSYPLQELGIDLPLVYQIVNKANLKPPTFFWPVVYERVKAELAIDPKFILPEWLFDMLFSWRSRTNCDRCFNQRYYEWVGLLTFHPERFWEAESWEHKGSNGDFYWNSNQKSLQQISDEREAILKKRVDYVVRQIRNLMNLREMKKQLKIFVDSNDEMIDVLSVKSCGLFCGK